MIIEFQIMDADYVQVNNHPLIRLFGKTKDGKSVCVFYEGYFPYFYFKSEKNLEDIKNSLEKNFQGLILKLDKVKKYNPIGYKKDKEEFYIVYLSDPSKVPNVRDFLVSSKLASKTYEADILFKYRFLSDFDIYGMRWYKVEGEPVNTQSIMTDLAIKAKSFEEINYMENAPLKILAFDIETTAKEGKPNPKKDKIIMISLAFSEEYEGKKSLVLVSKPTKQNGETRIFKDEREVLEEFVNIVLRYDPDIIVGYNINSFDLPFIKERMRENKITSCIGRATDKPLQVNKVGEEYRAHIIGRVIVDVYEIVKEMVSRGLIRLKRYTLDDVGRALVGEGKIEIKHGDISRIWERGSSEEVEKLIEYSKRDAMLVLRIFLERRILDKYIELSRVCGLLLQDVLNEGEAAKIECLLLREFNKRDYVLPNKPSSEETLKRKEERELRGIKGALVLNPKVGLYTTPIVYLDFKSMYPTIYMNFNICPSTIVLDNGFEEDKLIISPYGAKFVRPEVRRGVIPQIVEFLINERDKVKKEMKKEKDEIKRALLDAKQEALKRMANAFYGYTGFIRGRVYILEIANSITSFGRYFIETTKKIVESSNKDWEVIYGDTDSIMVKIKAKDLEEAFKIGEEIEKTINSYYQEKMTVKIESIFKTFLIVSKKRYAGISVEKTESGYKEKLVMKGIETVRRDWCNLTEKVLSKVLELLLKEGNVEKTLEYVKDVISKLERNEVNIEDLVIVKSLTRDLNDYKGTQPHVELVKKLMKRSPEKVPAIGDRIGYVIVSGPDLVSKRAEDPEYVIENKLKIDSKYYIENQILPPIERILEVVGISRQKLFSNGKQMLLSSIMTTDSNKTQELKDYGEKFDSFVCEKCGKTYYSPPFTGKCGNCGGTLLFSLNGFIFKKIKVAL
ncbi:MAG: DNA polymerase domain-containing protein [Candidatus Aenigmatarchaeota archaeon]